MFLFHSFLVAVITEEELTAMFSCTICLSFHPVLIRVYTNQWSLPLRIYTKWCSEESNRKWGEENAELTVHKTLTFPKVCCKGFPGFFIVITDRENTEMNTRSLFNKNTFVIAFFLGNPFPSVHSVSNDALYLNQFWKLFFSYVWLLSSLSKTVFTLYFT